MEDESLTRGIIGCAFTVHRTLGPGFLEKVYTNSLAIELRKAGFEVRLQAPIAVLYQDQMVGEYYADLLVADRVIVEVKAGEALNPAHETQLVNYLVATGVDVGLLINFGASVQVKRKHRKYRPKGTAQIPDL
jgi:GxxExxY protein